MYIRKFDCCATDNTQEHDDFCDSLHLDGVVFPVAPVVNPATGAQRVIIPGRITATR